ncbi:MAG: hypothetical protein ACI9YB_002374 [Halioglobus sp.]
MFRSAAEENESVLAFRLSKEDWLEAQKAVREAFPDWSFHLSSTRKIRDDAVDVVVKITGTHTELLMLPFPEFRTIMASGVKIELPEERVTVTLNEGKIAAMHLHNIEGGGIAGILQQLNISF